MLIFSPVLVVGLGDRLGSQSARSDGDETTPSNHPISLLCAVLGVSRSGLSRLGA